MRKAYQVIAYWIALLVFALGLLSVNGFGPLLRLLRKEKGTRISQSLIHRLCVFFLWLLKSLTIMQVRFVDWPEDLAKSKAILVSNHPSKFDVLLFLSRIPAGFCVYKDALRSSMLFGPTAHSIGYISNAEGTDGVRQTIGRIERGGQLIFFPEGTRSSPGSLDQLSSLYSVASRYAECPVHLFHIHPETNLLSKNHVFWKTPLLPARYEVRFLAQYQPAEFSTANQLHSAVSRRLREAATDYA